jgi:hypothetical protein
MQPPDLISESLFIYQHTQSHHPTRYGTPTYGLGKVGSTQWQRVCCAMSAEVIAPGKAPRERGCGTERERESGFTAGFREFAFGIIFPDHRLSNTSRTPLLLSKTKS